MIIFAHRINTVQGMKALPSGLGAEMDVRDQGKDLIAVHDAFRNGDLFEEVLSAAGQRPLIVNVKCEGIENAVIDLLSKHGIENYFLLDCTFPAIIKLVNTGFSKIAIRFSEYEGMDTLISMRGKCEWVWADCFTGIPFDHGQFAQIQDMGYKICFVSPDLLGRPEQLKQTADQLKQQNSIPDGVCVKQSHIAFWHEMNR